MVMGGRIPEETIEHILQQLDIVDFVGQYVQLKKSGRYYFGLCPFHTEKSPSFSVTPDKQIFHCFGCGVGGTAVQFLMELEQLTFPEAMQQLAENMGIEIPSTGYHEPLDEEKKSLYEVLDLAAKWFHHVLVHSQQGASARAYLLDRKLTQESVQEFQLGFSPKDGRFLLSFFKKRGYNESVLEKAGIMAVNASSYGKRYYPRFLGRVMFPIHDTQGRVIGFGGRSLQDDQQPKYINSPETTLFQKSNHLFHFHRARTHIRKKQQAILFEGFLDVITAWQSGIQNGIAMLGTSLTEQHVKIIQRNTSALYLCFDSDQAGMKATQRAIELMDDSSCVVKIALMPRGMDPDDFLKTRGVSAFNEQVLSTALSTTSFQLEQIKKQYQLTDDDQRMNYVEQAMNVIVKLQRPVEQDHYLRKLAEEQQLSIDALKLEFRQVKTRQKKDKQRDKEKSAWNNGYQEVNNQLVLSQGPKSIVEKSEMHLIYYMLLDRSVAEWVQENLGADFHSEIYTILAAHLYAFYEKGHSADIKRFIQCLPDPALASKVSEITMLSIPEKPSLEELQGCVQHIRNYPLQQQIEEKAKSVERLANAGEPIKAAQLLAEMLQDKINKR